MLQFYAKRYAAEGYWERLPYDNASKTSVFHTREFDLFRILQVIVTTVLTIRIRISTRTRMLTLPLALTSAAVAAVGHFYHARLAGGNHEARRRGRPPATKALLQRGRECFLSLSPSPLPSAMTHI
jgi:hypothetical protein